jgi:DNA repair exonuclease SbcCD ATPase subunit
LQDKYRVNIFTIAISKSGNFKVSCTYKGKYRMTIIADQQWERIKAAYLGGITNTTTLSQKFGERKPAIEERLQSEGLLWVNKAPAENALVVSVSVGAVSEALALDDAIKTEIESLKSLRQNFSDEEVALKQRELQLKAEAKAAIAAKESEIANLQNKAKEINLRIPKEQRVQSALLEVKQLTNEINSTAELLRGLIIKLERVGEKYTSDWNQIHPGYNQRQLVQKTYNLNNKLPVVKVLSDGAVHITSNS